MGMISQAQTGSRSHRIRKAAATRTKKRKPAMEISRRDSCGKGMTAMSTVPTATSAKSGRRIRMEPEKPMGNAVLDDGGGGADDLGLAGGCASRQPDGTIRDAGDGVTGCAPGSGSR